jgi:bifunctional pyridoxal-dependent enzyme with beta-cystathionase and maltose regulon repressor activities
VTIRIDTSDFGNRPRATPNIAKKVKMAKTGSPWGKTHSKSKIEEWLQVRQKVKPAKVRPSLLFAALQEVIAEVKEIVSSKASHDEVDTSVPGYPFLIPVCSSFAFGTELR